MCPVAHILPQQVAEAAAAVEGVGEVEVNLVWDPPWTKDMMSEEARVALDHGSEPLSPGKHWKYRK